MSTSSNKLKTGVKMGWERRERYRRWWKTDYVKDCVCDRAVGDRAVCERVA